MMWPLLLVPLSLLHMPHPLPHDHWTEVSRLVIPPDMTKSHPLTSIKMWDFCKSVSSKWDVEEHYLSRFCKHHFNVLFKCLQSFYLYTEYEIIPKEHKTKYCAHCVQIFGKKTTTAIYIEIKYLHYHNESYQFARLILWQHWCVWYFNQIHWWKALRIIQNKLYMFVIELKLKKSVDKCVNLGILKISVPCCSISQDKHAECKIIQTDSFTPVWEDTCVSSPLLTCA